MSDFSNKPGYGSILPMDDTTKYQAIGYIAGATVDWLGGIYLQDDVYKGRSRLRSYEDNKVFNSNDHKECMALPDSHNREEQVSLIKKTLLTVKKNLLENGGKVDVYSFMEWKDATPTKVIDWMKDQPWCHMKNIS